MLTKKTPKNGAGLHQFVATGGNPKQYQGTKGVMPPKGQESKTKVGK